MPGEDKNKPLVQLGKAEQRRNGAPSSGAPTVYNVKHPADAYAWFLNNGEVIDDKGNVVEKKPETLPVTPKATPMGVVDENGVNDNRYKTGMDYLRGISGDAGVISPEEEQRRLRRMRTASAIGNLGNVMSAFANLYYVNKGAPSQKVPDAVVPDYMSFVDRVNQARKNAEAMQLQRDRLTSQDAYRDRQMAVQEEKNRINAEKTQAYSEYYKAMEAKNNEQAAYWKVKAEALERGMPLDEALKLARKAQAEAAANNSNASAAKNMALAEAARNGKETTVTRTDALGGTTTTQTFQKPASRQNGNSGRTGNTGNGKKKINW